MLPLASHHDDDKVRGGPNHLKTDYIYNIMPYKDKEKQREYSKKYEQEHREEINARRRLNQNKREYNRRYREEHRDEINAKQNVKFVCPCGSSYFKRNYATHIKAKTC